MIRRFLCMGMAAIFLANIMVSPQELYAQQVLNLPKPGTMINLSSAYEPVMIKGLTLQKDNPFLFDFIVDAGQSGYAGDVLKNEADRLVKYFFACLTIPDNDLWVNLSPYEKDRMVPDALGQTALGRDLLVEDYMLKQLTASLIYPEKNLGKSFWDKVYAKAQQMYGNTNIPVNTFNKVWIVADQASIYEQGQTVFVVDGHLKVMLEEDYLAMGKQAASAGMTNNANSLGSQIIREIVIPELEKEVNTGKNFATLRQIFNSLILSSWFKKNLKQAILNEAYADKSIVKGMNLTDSSVNEQIYQQYLKAYKKGVFDYIRDDEQLNGQKVPRKYFSGGFKNMLKFKDPDEAMVSRALSNIVSPFLFNVGLVINQQALKELKGAGRQQRSLRIKRRDAAMVAEDNLDRSIIPAELATVLDNVVEQVFADYGYDNISVFERATSVSSPQELTQEMLRDDFERNKAGDCIGLAISTQRRIYDQLRLAFGQNVKNVKELGQDYAFEAVVTIKGRKYRIKNYLIGALAVMPGEEFENIEFAHHGVMTKITDEETGQQTAVLTDAGFAIPKSVGVGRSVAVISGGESVGKYSLGKAKVQDIEDYIQQYPELSWLKSSDQGQEVLRKLTEEGLVLDISVKGFPVPRYIFLDEPTGDRYLTSSYQLIATPFYKRLLAVSFEHQERPQAVMFVNLNTEKDIQTAVSQLTDESSKDERRLAETSISLTGIYVNPATGQKEKRSFSKDELDLFIKEAALSAAADYSSSTQQLIVIAKALGWLGDGQRIIDSRFYQKIRMILERAPRYLASLSSIKSLPMAADTDVLNVLNGQLVETQIGEFSAAFDHFVRSTDEKALIIDQLTGLVKGEFDQTELKAQGSFLDVGAGRGVITQAIAPYFHSAVAVELNSEDAAHMRSLSIPQLNVVNQAVQEFEPNQKFDFILLSQFLYYLTPEERAKQIARFRQWLKPGGRMAFVLNDVKGEPGSLQDLIAQFGTQEVIVEAGEIARYYEGEGLQTRRIPLVAKIENADPEIMMQIIMVLNPRPWGELMGERDQIQAYMKKHLWDSQRNLYSIAVPQQILVVTNQDAAMFSHPLGFENQRAFLDRFTADPKDVTLFAGLKRTHGISPKEVSGQLRQKFNALYHDNPHGAVNPIQLLIDNPALEEFLLRVFNVRKIREGMDPDLMRKIFLKLKERPDDPEEARRRLYRELIDFKTDPSWNEKRGKKDSSNDGPVQILSILERMDIKPESQIVNIGANNSSLGYSIAERFPQARMVDSDIASAKAVGWKFEGLLPNLRFHQQQGPVSTGFEDHSVDVVILSSMLHHVAVQDMFKFIKEIKRILKPGGKLILREDSFSYTQAITPTADFSEELTRELLSHDQEFILNAFIFIDWMANTVMRDSIMPMPFNFHSREQWRDIFAHYGFGEERCVFYGMPYMRTIQEFVVTGEENPAVPVPIQIDRQTRRDLLIDLIYTNGQQRELRNSYGIRELTRAGWINQKKGNSVPRAETVATHSWGVGFLSLLFAPVALDLKRVAATANIHDIAEGVMKRDYIPGEIAAAEKRALETRILAQTLQPFDDTQKGEWMNMFEELEEGSTPEARFVKAMDRFDMWIQARIYQRKYPGNINADDFLASARRVIEEQGEVAKHVLDIVEHPEAYTSLLNALEKIYEVKDKPETGAGESAASQAWARTWTYLTTTRMDNPNVLSILRLLTIIPVVDRPELQEPLKLVLDNVPNGFSMIDAIAVARTRVNQGLIDDLMDIVSQVAKEDKAMAITPGGIDLNTSSGMTWKVSKDGQGVEVNLDSAMLSRIRREGIGSLSPVILKMTPIRNVWPLAVGLKAPLEVQVAGK